MKFQTAPGPGLRYPAALSIAYGAGLRAATDEFIRRFLIHALPDAFHRIRPCGLRASAARKANIAKSGLCSACAS